MEQNHSEKRYGPGTAIALVIGLVIGSGVFFKAEAVLNKTAGNMPMGILAWLMVGAVMVICSYVFAIMATRYHCVGGLTDLAEAAVNPLYGYLMGWFAAAIYAPCLVSAVSWVAARYVCVLLGWSTSGGACMTIAAFFLIAAYAVNVLSPPLAGKVQVSTTVIKMIPLLLMAVVGTLAGLGSGLLADNLATANTAQGGSLMGAAVSVAFAYEGWVLATSIGGELKDAHKNLPIALVGGAVIVVLTYVLYYIGLSGAVSTEEMMANGQAAAQLAFRRVFGDFAGTTVFVLVVISCLGTLNGLLLSGCRGFYTLAIRGSGPCPTLLKQTDPVTGIPVNSAVAGLLVNMAWLLYFYGAVVDYGWFGSFSFDSSELPVITLYAMYVPMFLGLMLREKTLSPFKRFVCPALGILGCGFMVYAAFAGYGFRTVLHYLMIYAVIMAIGVLFYKSDSDLSS